MSRDMERQTAADSAAAGQHEQARTAGRTKKIHPYQSADILNDLAVLLDRLGVPCRRSGGKLRLPAVWRGGSGLNVSVFPGGGWNDFASGEHGNLKALLDNLGVEGLDRESLEQAAQRLDRRALAEAATLDRQRTLKTVQRLHGRGIPLVWHDKTPGEGLAFQAVVESRRRIALKASQVRPAIAYLENRGLPFADIAHATRVKRNPLDPSVDEDLRFLPDPEGGVLLFPIHAPTPGGELIGVQRVFLTPDGRPRFVDEDGTFKKMLGSAFHAPGAAGGWLIYGDRERCSERTLCLAEGPETGLAAHAGTGAATYILYSAGGLAAVSTEYVQSLNPDRVLIAADHDASGTGLRAARVAAWRLHQAGVQHIAIALPPKMIDGQGIGTAKGSDWLDVMAAAGSLGTGELLKSCATDYIPSPLDATLRVHP
ncbi:MAG: toprim domain-containing protein, partial [Pseudomonadota bacterium]|nr:toprim domain-containing protein [Pseudomonadota bacterium]